MNQLTRVQVYLESENIILLDKIARESKITRSQVIRDAIEKTVKAKEKRERSRRKKSRKSTLMELAGIEESKTGTVGLNVDEIYLND